MAGRIILGIANPALDANGEVDAGATLTFYENGTTTLQSIYTSPTLLTALANPLSPNAAGRFPQVWASDGSAYSVKWSPSGATPITYDDIKPQASSLLSLSDYSALTPFVPTLSFGGASVGMNYTSQIGYWSKVGSIYFFDAYIALSAKGSSAGAARVGGLPATSANVGGPGFPVTISMDAMATLSCPMARVGNNSTLINLYDFTSSALATMTQANFANTSNLSIKGHFNVAP